MFQRGKGVTIGTSNKLKDRKRWRCLRQCTRKENDKHITELKGEKGVISGVSMRKARWQRKNTERRGGKG